MPTRCGIYARVSTNEQSCEPQLNELREFGHRRGWTIQEYVDIGWSGAKDRRPQLDRMLADCRKRRLEVVLVYRFDRFARSVRQLVLALDEFRSLGIDFVSVHEGCDTSTPNGRLVFNIFASIAEFERELIKDRVRSGLAAARKRGQRLGRPKRRRGRHPNPRPTCRRDAMAGTVEAGGPSSQHRAQGCARRRLARSEVGRLLGAGSFVRTLIRRTRLLLFIGDTITMDLQQPTPQSPSLSDLLLRAVGVRSAVAPYLASDFAAFAKAAWKVVNPREPLMWSPAYDLLCQALMLMAERHPKWRRVIWNHPPRLAKSFFCSIAYPCWVWLRDPSHRFVCASYSMDLSNKHNAARRLLITSAWFQGLFAERFKLVEERADELVNDKGGSMFSTSVGARFTGFGFDTCIADDLTSTDMAPSDADRGKANVWFDSTLRQRANDPASAAIWLVSQRVHEQDVPGYLLASEPGIWTHVSVPLIGEEPTTYEIGTVKWARPKGDVLLPKRFPPHVVKELQSRRLIFSGQYQQIPVPLEGNLVRASDLMYYGGVDPVTGAQDERLPAQFDLKIISVDCAFKNYSDSDFTAILTIGVKGRKRFILDVVNSHLDVGGMEAAIRTQRDRWGPINAVLVESAASGIAVAQRLRVNVGGVVEVTPQGGKVARMAAASPEFQAHDWYFDRNAAWSPLLREQLLFFPRGKHDDMCDAVSQAAIWLQEHGNLSEPTPFLKGESAFSIQGLRQYLAGEAPHAFPAHVSDKVAKGEPLTDQDWDDACFSSIREFM